MKQFYILLFLVCTTILKAQDVRLFENTWYLTKIVSDGIDYLPPTNSNVSSIRLTFGQQENSINTNVCNSMFGNVVFGNELTSFSLPNGLGSTLIVCQLNSDAVYEYLYYNFFQELAYPNINFFTYSIDPTPTEPTLTIISSSNKKAIYTNRNLSTVDFEELDFNVYFEAESSFLVVENASQNLREGEVELFDILGKRLKTKTLDSNQTKIGVSDLSKGVYFVRIKLDNKETVRKVIKP